jgi:hypothetical protein
VFLGHYGAALAAKRAAARVSLGTAVLAAQLLDLLWPLFLILGWERVRVAPGLMAASSLDFVHYPISHSLLAAVGWGVLVGGAYHAVRRSPRGALVVGALVVSHWLLDAPFHRPDLPLWPGSDTLVGAGLWNSVPITLVAEFGVLALGLALYLRATRPADRIGRWALWGGVAVLVLFYLGSLAGPPPGEEALAWGGLTLWLLVPWGYWVDRHRTTARPATAGGR